MTVAAHWYAGLGRTLPLFGDMWGVGGTASCAVRDAPAGAERGPVDSAQWGARWSVVLLGTVAVVLAVLGGGWWVGGLVAGQLGVALGMVGVVERPRRRAIPPVSSSVQGRS